MQGLVDCMWAVFVGHCKDFGFYSDDVEAIGDFEKSGMT